MSSALANAAVNRIARVVQSPASTHPVMTALDFVHRALEDDVAKALSGVDLNALFFWYGDDREPVLRFVSFAGLVELGVRSRYVSLFDWEGANVLEQALRQFRTENASSDSVDLHLVDALLGRFGAPPAGSWSLDPDVSGVFESYLTLTSRVRGDEGVRTFLDDTSDGKIVPGDLSALVSPRHFAETFETGSIDGVPATDVAAGYRLLGYLEWLADILEALRNDDVMRSGIVRHARWAGNADRIRDRFRGWVNHMLEWRVGDRSWSDARWFEFEIRVFAALMEEQSRLVSVNGEEPPPEKSATTGETEAPAVKAEVSLEDQVKELLSQGRPRAARELALARAVAASGDEPTLGRATWTQWAEELIARCVILASTGGHVAASALVAPIMPRLLEQHGRSGWQMVADAQGLMAHGRTETEPGEVVPMTETAEEQRYQARRQEAPREEPRQRRMGESSY